MAGVVAPLRYKSPPPPTPNLLHTHDPKRETHPSIYTPPPLPETITVSVEMSRSPKTILCCKASFQLDFRVFLKTEVKPTAETVINVAH